MPRFSVTIDNLPQIKRAFRLAPALTVREVDKAIQKSIFQIERDEKATSPVRTGYMRSSVQSKFTPLKGELSWPNSPNPAASGRRPAPVSLYSFFVHEGTKFMPARPWLANAVKSDHDKVNAYFEEAVQNVFNQIARDSD